MGTNSASQENRAQGLEAREEFERLVTGIAAGLINLPSNDIDSGIQKALEKIGSFADVDRCYIFLTSPDGRNASMTHEWSASGVPSLRNDFKDLPISINYLWLLDHLGRGETFVVSDITELPENAA
ncbi:MAG: Fis family transcriptional regulator, partial [Deltaproteobacteria bacterium]|nr:Fis family transcriptional regulator [Deltaproteobacteria bacterium]